MSHTETRSPNEKIGRSSRSPRLLEMRQPSLPLRVRTAPEPVSERARPRVVMSFVGGDWDEVLCEVGAAFATPHAAEHGFTIALPLDASAAGPESELTEAGAR